MAAKVVIIWNSWELTARLIRSKDAKNTLPPTLKRTRLTLIDIHLVTQGMGAVRLLDVKKELHKAAKHAGIAHSVR